MLVGSLGGCAQTCFYRESKLDSQWNWKLLNERIIWKGGSARKLLLEKQWEDALPRVEPAAPRQTMRTDRHFYLLLALPFSSTASPLKHDTNFKPASPGSGLDCQPVLGHRWTVSSKSKFAKVFSLISGHTILDILYTEDVGDDILYFTQTWS